MSKLVPQYTTWEAINTAIALGMRALEEIRLLARTPGKQGDPGKDGAPGKLPAVREWSDLVHYDGDVVTRDGAMFQAIRDTAKCPPHDDWQCLAGRGRDGNNGLSLTQRGTWSADGEYRALDMVAFNGGSFCAKVDSPGVCPGDGWQLMAGQGKRGNPGERGAKGDRGPAGPSVVEMTVDDQGLLKLRNADGSTVTCDLYPLLTKIGA